MDNLNLEMLFDYLKKLFSFIFRSSPYSIFIFLFFLYSANQKKNFMSQELYKSYLNELSTFDGAEIEILERN